MSDGRTWGSVVGAVAGFFLPGVGWALGAALGGALGGLLEPTKRTESGRVDDLKVSVSQYGGGIPETWGNDVPPATWVWATDIIEIGEEQGSGKGGGGQVNTNYRQFIHGYLVLGRTPPVGSTVQIRKVWVDGKLTFDSSTGLSVAQALASEENPFAQISVHPGFEDQIPHPIMEFYEGIGNTPAYRGVVGVFVFGLECPGGRVPQISFEVCIDASTEVIKSQFSSVDAVAGNNVAYAVVRSEAAWHYTVSGTDGGGTFTLDVTYLGPGYATKKNLIRVEGAHYGLAPIPVSGDGTPGAIRMRRSTTGDFNSTNYLDFFNLQDGGYSAILTWIPGSAAKEIRPASAGYDSATGKYAVIGGGSDFVNNVAIIDGGVITRSDGVPGSAGPVTIKDDRVYALSATGGALRVTVFDGTSGGQLSSWPGPAFADSSMGWAMIHPGDDALYVWIRILPNYSLFRINYATGVWTLVDNNVNTTPTAKLGLSPATLYADARKALIGPSSASGGKHFYTFHRFNVVQPAEVNVSKVIESQSTAAGLRLDQLDLSAITDHVWGYTFNKSPADARSNIAPLLTYGGIGMVEEDGLIRYFHRSDRPIGELIPWDDLGCMEDGQEAEDAFPLTRTQAMELPRSVTVSYLNPSFDYQSSAETAQRIVTDSQLDEQVTLPLVMTANAAATIAHRLLWEKWTAQNTHTCKVSRKYAMLSPGDVRPIEYPRGTVGNYLAVKVTDTGALMEIEWMPADAELLTQTVPGSTGSGQQIAPLTPPTQLTVVDSAILRDADDNAGVYAAMAGLDASWAGSVLWVGDDEQSLENRGSVTQPAVQGLCESALPNYTLGNVDEHNLLTVNVGPGALASITRDVLLNGTQNVAAIGAAGRWEIVKFQRADSLGSGRYLLSGLLRGLQGTEWAAELHKFSDRFVLLSAGGVLRPVFEVGSIGTNKAYRAVSIGRRFDSASTQYSVNTGEALRPLSSTTLRKSFATNDIVLTWRRRSRLSNQWWLGNVPLGEEAERYEVDVFADGTFAALKRTLTSTSPTVTYTSAQQVADFGGNQTTVHVRIYQVSGAVGRGHELQQSI